MSAHRPGPQPAWLKRWSRTRLGRMWRAGNENEIMHRSFGFAALGFTTLIPLLIVVAAATSLRGGGGFPSWVVGGIGLSGRSAQAVRELFTSNGKVMSTTTAVSAAGLAVFGMSFADCVKRGLEHIWDLPQAGLRSAWRQLAWLAVLVGFLLAVADFTAIGHGPARSAVKAVLTMCGSLLFFWWTARFLLNGQIGWRALLPGAAFTVVGLGGLRACSSLVFGPFIVSSAVSYGAIGTVLIIVSWLIGVGYVVFGGALLGRYLGSRHRIPGPSTEL